MKDEKDETMGLSTEHLLFNMFFHLTKVIFRYPRLESDYVFGRSIDTGVGLTNLNVVDTNRRLREEHEHRVVKRKLKSSWITKVKVYALSSVVIR